MDYDQADAFRFNKVINEPDFLPLHMVRQLAQASTLVRAKCGKLVTTPLGKSRISRCPPSYFHLIFTAACDLSAALTELRVAIQLCGGRAVGTRIAPRAPRKSTSSRLLRCTLHFRDYCVPPASQRSHCRIPVAIRSSSAPGHPRARCHRDRRSWIGRICCLERVEPAGHAPGRRGLDGRCHAQSCVPDRHGGLRAIVGTTKRSIDAIPST
jgi:hypothetical protein